MQPGMAGRFGAVRQQEVDVVLVTTAAEAAARRGGDRMAVQPFCNAAMEGTGLGGRPRQPAIELGHSSPLLEVNLPVLARPTITTGPEQSHDLGFMPRNFIEHRGRRRRCCAQGEIVAIECELYTGCTGRLESLDRVHSRVLQALTVFAAGGAEAGKGGKGGD